MKRSLCLLLLLPLVQFVWAQSPEAPISLEDLPSTNPALKVDDTVSGQEQPGTTQSTYYSSGRQQSANQPSTEGAQDQNANKAKKSANKKFRFGIIGGYVWSSNSWMIEQGSEKYNQSEFIKGRHGFTVGVTGEVSVGRLEAIEFGLKLSRSGFLYEEPSTSEGFLKMDFARMSLDIPILFKMHMSSSSKWYAQIGLVPNFSVGGKATWEDHEIGSTTLDAKKVFRKFNCAFNIGVGYGPILLYIESNFGDTWSKDFITLFDSTGYKTVSQKYTGLGVALNLKF